MYNVPTIADFKNYYVRDFPFQPAVSTVAPIVTIDINNYIQDSDIRKAMTKASLWVNSEIFPSQAAYTDGYLLMIAHCLVMSIRASSQGLSGKFEWATGSKGVGSISISQSIPSSITENPTYAWLAMSNYGAEYIISILPYLHGQMYTVVGGTQP